MGNIGFANIACPKDPFPISKIDRLVGATYGHLRMSFLDAFQGYHLIALALKTKRRRFYLPERQLQLYGNVV